PVRDELARLLARRAQAEPVDDVVHAQLEVAEQVQAGDARLARRLVEIVAELLLEQPVDPPRLLLGAQLQAVVGRLALAGLAVHAGRERAALDGALGRVAALALQVQLGALAAAKAADRAPGDDVAVDVGDGDDRVVERALDVSLPLDHVLALAAARANDLLLGHYLPAFTFFLPATARLGPRRLRALVRVRWPRTGRPRRCRMPRYEPISVRRLM